MGEGVKHFPLKITEICQKCVENPNEQKRCVNLFFFLFKLKQFSTSESNYSVNFVLNATSTCITVLYLYEIHINVGQL